MGDEQRLSVGAAAELAAEYERRVTWQQNPWSTSGVQAGERLRRVEEACVESLGEEMHLLSLDWLTGNNKEVARTCIG